MQTAQSLKARRVELALAENARIDRAIAALRLYKLANIKSAQADDSWAEVERYFALGELEAALDLDTADAQETCKDNLRSEHSYDIEDDCCLNQWGDFSGESYDIARQWQRELALEMGAVS